MTDEKTSARVGSDAARMTRMSYPRLITWVAAHPKRAKAVAASAFGQMANRVREEAPE